MGASSGAGSLGTAAPRGQGQDEHERGTSCCTLHCCITCLSDDLHRGVGGGPCRCECAQNESAQATPRMCLAAAHASSALRRRADPQAWTAPSACHAHTAVIALRPRPAHALCGTPTHLPPRALALAAAASSPHAVGATASMEASHGSNGCAAGAAETPPPPPPPPDDGQQAAAGGKSGAPEARLRIEYMSDAEVSLLSLDPAAVHRSISPGCRRLPNGNANPPLRPSSRPSCRRPPSPGSSCCPRCCCWPPWPRWWRSSSPTTRPRSCS